MDTDDTRRLTSVTLHPRPKQTDRVQICDDIVADLDAITKRRGMSRESLLRFYMGQGGLRADLDRVVAERVLDETTLLARHQLPGETVKIILQKIAPKRRIMQLFCCKTVL